MSLLTIEFVESLFKSQKEESLFGRWIHHAHITPLIEQFSNETTTSLLGYSENKLPIHAIKIGFGEKKILIWSQMHGNESTGTKAMFDLLNCLVYRDDEAIEAILTACTIICVPMLNPDGAYNYTRENQNGIDLNRDAVAKNAVESELLRSMLDSFKPDFCFNLHDQRTIFGVEGTTNPATISFLAPSEEVTRAITKGRKETMNVIVAMNSLLQQIIPDHIGRYSDEYYPTATGDNFQKLGYNTILIEAGHFPKDYDREEVRKFNFHALLQGIYHISATTDFSDYEEYFSIPNNQQNFFDIIETNKATKKQVAYQYEEKIKEGAFYLDKKKVEKADLTGYLAHSEITVEK